MPTPRKASEKDALSKSLGRTLLEAIDNSGGLAVFKNKSGERKHKLEPLLEELRVFGKKGDPRREQANQLYQYWYKVYFLTGKYDQLLFRYDIESSIPLEPIPSATLFSSPLKTKSS